MTAPAFYSPILVIVLPLIGGFALPGAGLLGDKLNIPRLREYLASAVVLATIYFVLDTSAGLGEEIMVYPLGGWEPPLGITLVIDGLGILLSIVVSIIAGVIIIYSLYFFKEEDRLSQYYTLMLFLLAGMLGVAYTGDIFNLYVFFEIMSIASYSLIAFYRTGDSVEGALKYLFIGSLGTGFILLGIVLLYAMTGTLNMADLSMRMSVLSAEGYSLTALISLGLLTVGFGMKVGMIPFHAWLPDAYQSAPIPVTTVMAGGTGVIGVGALLRVGFLVFGSELITPLLMGLGLLTMVAGALLALRQSDLIRLLAYSSISQMGYIFLGLGIGTSLGVSGGLYHLMNKAVFKSLLFLAAGIIVYKTGSSDMNKLGGLAVKMPVTATLFGVGALALVGIPPLNGFVSKASIIYAGIRAGHPVLSALASFSAALSLTYILRAFISVFLGESTPLTEDIKFSREYRLLIPVCILAVFTLLLGILPGFGFEMVAEAEAVLLEPLEYIESVFPAG